MYLLLQAETKFYNGLLYYGEGGNLWTVTTCILDLYFNTLIAIKLYKAVTAYLCYSVWL